MASKIDELMENPREELDKVAAELGIDSSELPNKTAVAREIIRAGEEGNAEKEPEPVKRKSGKTGVMAKRAAMDRKIDEIGKAARDIAAEGTRNMNEGIKEKEADMKAKAREIEKAANEMAEKGAREMGAGIKAQINENEKAAKNIAIGIGEIEADIKAEAADMKAKAHEIEKAANEIAEKGAREMGAGIKAQINENEKYIDHFEKRINDFYYG